MILYIDTNMIRIYSHKVCVWKNFSGSNFWYKTTIRCLELEFLQRVSENQIVSSEKYRTTNEDRMGYEQMDGIIVSSFQPTFMQKEGNVRVYATWEYVRIWSYYHFHIQSFSQLILCDFQIYFKFWMISGSHTNVKCDEL